MTFFLTSDNEWTIDFVCMMDFGSSAIMLLLLELESLSVIYSIINSFTKIYRTHCPFLFIFPVYSYICSSLFPFHVPDLIMLTYQPPFLSWQSLSWVLRFTLSGCVFLSCTCFGCSCVATKLHKLFNHELIEFFPLSP